MEGGVRSVEQCKIQRSRKNVYAVPLHMAPPTAAASGWLLLSLASISAVGGLSPTPSDGLPPMPPYSASAWLLGTPPTPRLSPLSSWLSNEQREVLPPGDAFARDLLRKRQALDDQDCILRVMVSDEHPATSFACQELSELILAHTQTYSDQQYRTCCGGSGFVVHATGERFEPDAWRGKELELASRIVREDLLLLRPGGSDYQLAAGCALCAFDLATTKVGTRAAELRGLVAAKAGGDDSNGGWSGQVESAIELLATNNAFGGMVSWSNAELRRTGRLLHDGVVWPLAADADTDADADAAAHSKGLAYAEDGEARQEDLWLRVEYHTLRVLPASGYLLLAVRTLTDPLPELWNEENGAAMARGVRDRLSTSGGGSSGDRLAGPAVRAAALAVLDAVADGDGDAGRARARVSNLGAGSTSPVSPPEPVVVRQAADDDLDAFALIKTACFG